VQLLCYPEPEVPEPLRQQVLLLRAQAWPPDGEDFHDPALQPLSMLLVEDGELRSALDVLSTNIVHRGSSYEVSGLATVVTDQAHRGAGYGRRLVAAAKALIAGSGADLGLFTCDRPLQPFYESAGWTALTDAVLVGGTREHPFPSDQFDKVTMAAFFSEPAMANAGQFEHCRIELYPGDIDKLW
jgi:aminoglycoside 2'-N-acetyltransferase I